MNNLKAIIIDDSKLLRSELKLLLKDFSEITVVGEAAKIDEAIILINKSNPDVIFLDIQLKTENGFDLLERTEINSKVIFVTAYDQYALRAFEVNALDYLQKPISKERLALAIKKLVPEPETEITIHKKLIYNDVIYLMINRSLKFVKVSSLQVISAEGKYSYIIRTNKKKDLVSKTLLEWEQILPQKYFLRIHRSTIVNFEYVKKVKKCSNNTHEVYVGDIEEPFIMSRRYAAKLKSLVT